ncbi:hypothetical protein QYM36_014163 [Artemia franciscana]|uniref:Uncharacterized protein n=1 Tax=Artemia franciscana TaxID=6661 RepID=A0AA88HJY4_ARTSF|nr:hypothetical protein QYM36_014163 [Artemia franciscana]
MVCNSASEQTITDVSSSSNELTVPQTEQVGNEISRGTTTPVEGLLEPQLWRHTPQDEEHRQSSGPTDISLSSLDPPSQPKLVQYPAKVTTNGKPKQSFNASYYGKHPCLEYSFQDDSVYCFFYRHFGNTSTLPGQRYGSRPFIDVGVGRWKDNNENKENREHVIASLKVTALLGRSGTAFWRHDETESLANKRNFAKTCNLLAEYSPTLFNTSTSCRDGMVTTLPTNTRMILFR